MASYYHWTKKVLLQLAQRHGVHADQIVAALRAGDIDDPVLAWDAVQVYCHSDGQTDRQTDRLAGFIEHALEHGVLGFGQTLSERLTDADGRLVDSVSQLENLQQLEKDFSARTGIPMTLGHANRSLRQAVEWDDALLQRIWQRYREDYASFGYAKQPLPAQ